MTDRTWRLCGLYLACLSLGVWLAGASLSAAEPTRVAQGPVLKPPAIVLPETAPSTEPIPATEQALPAPEFTPPPVATPLYSPPPIEAPSTGPSSVVPTIPAPAYRVPLDTRSVPTILPEQMPTQLLAQTSSGKPVKVAYRHWGRKKVKDCDPLVPQMLCVAHPCSDCEVRVPVCIPACCVNCEPKVHARKAVFSDSLVSYEWEHGIKIVVRFERAGNLIVTYHGM